MHLVIEILLKKHRKQFFNIFGIQWLNLMILLHSCITATECQFFFGAVPVDWWSSGFAVLLSVIVMTPAVDYYCISRAGLFVPVWSKNAQSGMSEGGYFLSPCSVCYFGVNCMLWTFVTFHCLRYRGEKTLEKNCYCPLHHCRMWTVSTPLSFHLPTGEQQWGHLLCRLIYVSLSVSPSLSISLRSRTGSLAAGAPSAARWSPGAKALCLNYPPNE